MDSRAGLPHRRTSLPESPYRCAWSKSPHGLTLVPRLSQKCNRTAFAVGHLRGISPCHTRKGGSVQDGEEGFSPSRPLETCSSGRRHISEGDMPGLCSFFVQVHWSHPVECASRRDWTHPVECASRRRCCCAVVLDWTHPVGCASRRRGCWRSGSGGTFSWSFLLVLPLLPLRWQPRGARHRISLRCQPRGARHRAARCVASAGGGWCVRAKGCS